MMHCALLLSAATLGVDYGWQPTDDGSLEYIIQLEPALLEAMAAGEPILSEVHPDAQGVTRFRIVVGNSRLPREVVSRPAESSPAGGRPLVGGMPRVRGGAPPGQEQAERSVVVPRDAPLPGPEPGAGEAPGASPAVPSLPDIASTPPELPASDRLRDEEPIEWPATAPNFGGSRFVPSSNETPPVERESNAPRTPADGGAFPRVITPPDKSGDQVNPIPDPDRSAGVPLAPPEFSPSAERSAPPVIEPPQRFTPQPPRDPNVQPASGLQAPASVAQASSKEPSPSPPNDASDGDSPNDEGSSSSEPERPWGTLVVGAFLLCLSISVNVYLGVLARGFYTRYRRLAQEIRTAPAVDGA